MPNQKDLLDLVSLPYDDETRRNLLSHYAHKETLLDAELLEEHLLNQPVLGVVLLFLLFLSLSSLLFSIVFVSCRALGNCGAKRYQPHPTSGRRFSVYLVTFLLSWVFVSTSSIFFVYSGVSFWGQKTPYFEENHAIVRREASEYPDYAVPHQIVKRAAAERTQSVFELFGDEEYDGNFEETDPKTTETPPPFVTESPAPEPVPIGIVTGTPLEHTSPPLTDSPVIDSDVTMPTTPPLQRVAITRIIKARPTTTTEAPTTSERAPSTQPPIEFPPRPRAETEFRKYMDNKTLPFVSDRWASVGSHSRKYDGGVARTSFNVAAAAPTLEIHQQTTTTIEESTTEEASRENAVTETTDNIAEVLKELNEAVASDNQEPIEIIGQETTMAQNNVDHEESTAATSAVAITEGSADPFMDDPVVEEVTVALTTTTKVITTTIPSTSTTEEPSTSTSTATTAPMTTSTTRTTTSASTTTELPTTTTQEATTTTAESHTDLLIVREFHREPEMVVETTTEAEAEIETTTEEPTTTTTSETTTELPTTETTTSMSITITTTEPTTTTDAPETTPLETGPPRPTPRIIFLPESSENTSDEPTQIVEEEEVTTESPTTEGSQTSSAFLNTTIRPHTTTTVTVTPSTESSPAPSFNHDGPAVEFVPIVKLPVDVVSWKTTERPNNSTVLIFPTAPLDSDNFGKIEQLATPLLFPFHTLHTSAVQWLARMSLILVGTVMVTVVLPSFTLVVVGSVCYLRSYHPMDRTRVSEKVGQLVVLLSTVMLFVLPLCLFFVQLALLYSHTHNAICPPIQLQYQQQLGLLDEPTTFSRQSRDVQIRMMVNSANCRQSNQPIEGMWLSCLVFCLSSIPLVFSMFKMSKYFLRMKTEYYWTMQDNYGTIYAKRALHTDAIYGNIYGTLRPKRPTARPPPAPYSEAALYSDGPIYADGGIYSAYTAYGRV